MGPLTTHVFRLATTASPGEVWQVLTSGDHLYGLALVSDWKPGSTVESGAAGTGYHLRGEVLAAAPPHRLSLVFGGTHLTWEVSPGVVRLFVDELDGDSDEHAVEVWGPVMAALASRLAARSMGSEPAEP